MSHISLIKVRFKSLVILKQTCKELGTVEFMQGQKTYKWYEKYMGDWPLPEGYTKEDLGKCEHAIRVKGNSEAYEIGVVKRRDGKPGWELIYDFFSKGKGLEKAVGKDCVKLRQAYAVLVATNKAVAQGFQVEKIKSKDGKKIRLRATRMSH